MRRRCSAGIVSDQDALDDGSPDGDPSGERDPIHRTFDLLVSAPLGVALTVRDDLPGLIAKGRQRIETEIANARMIGEFVVTKGTRDVTTIIEGLLHTTESDVEDAEAEEDTAAATGPSGPGGIGETATSPKPAPDPADDARVEAALAGYDTLSASQVVRRLESLGPDELHAVHRHEASHRNRRTILNRTNQLLQAGSPPPDTPAAAAD